MRTTRTIRTIRTIRGMQRLSRDHVAKGGTIGLVPTMGFLHDGHLSLIKRVARYADLVVTSIFVNPTQFGPQEDFNRYPRDVKGDIAKVRAAGGHVVFLPKAGEMYPEGFQSWVEVDQLTRRLEGAERPGHFRGVTTVVAKLFNVVRPDAVVFGMKDFQQAIVLRRMTLDLGYPIRFIIAPTLRESDGLAMSSRNRYFTPEQRPEAIALYRALSKARKMFRAGARSAAEIRKAMTAVTKKVSPGAQIHYISFNDFQTLEEVRTVRAGVVVSLAVTIHGVRLIDNMKLS